MKRRGKYDPRGRESGSTERFVMVRRSLLHSPQFSAMSCTSRALLFELQAMFNGTNNGAIFLSVRDATARLGLADFKAVQVAFDELRQLGWITETVAGCFALKAGEVSRARAWHLNWIGRDGKSTGSDVLPDLDYSVLSKKQKRRVSRRQLVLSEYLKDYQRRQFAVEDSTTLNARMAAALSKSVEESITREEGNVGKQPICSVGESATHIKYHSPVTADQMVARRARLRLSVVGGSPQSQPTIERLSNNQTASRRTLAA